jgi:hypothetical protein
MECSASPSATAISVASRGMSETDQCPYPVCVCVVCCCLHPILGNVRMARLLAVITVFNPILPGVSH